MTKIHSGMNRAELDRELINLGGEVLLARRTGEVVYTHPALPDRARANGRRKDAPRRLTQFVKEVIREMNRAKAANDHVFERDVH